MEFVLCLIVLAITYNQGAARPASRDLELLTKNDLASSGELSPRISDDGVVFLIPTSIKEGLIITINGTLNTKDKWLTVVLPSTSGSEDCQIKYSFEDGTIVMTPVVPGSSGSYDYGLNITQPQEKNSTEPTFSLRLQARTNTDGEERLGMFLNVDNAGDGDHLMCKIKNFQDVNQIIMKEGVADIHSLMFEFEHNH